MVGGSAESAARSERAKKSYNPITKAERKAATKYENQVAELVGGEFAGDNKPFDVLTDTHGIEVKTIFEGKKKPYITMHPDSLDRKRKAARQQKIRTATIVIDTRGRGAQFYYRNGLGSFSLSTMEKVSPNELREKFI